ncbi:MAG: hypothetical protein KDJ67_04630 [Nitratireductor sp.]|nr:hypothetical protein [Nitratireductor sp.]
MGKMEKTGADLHVIKSRLVLNFPGFEQTDAMRQLDRIRHSAQKTGEVWGFFHERVSAETAPSGHFATSENTATGNNWQVNTRIIQFSWNDVIRSYEQDGHPHGFLTNMPKFLAFFFDGTVRRYRKASPRYWAFTIFPVLLLAIFAAISAAISWWALGLVMAADLVKTLLIVIATIMGTLILAKWPGDRMYLLLTINDWGFARDMVNSANPVIDKRYQEFADVLGEEIAASGHDEIIIAGHSFGSLWAVAALALALEKNPGLLRDKPVTFLALGSSLLKIALAPNAKFMRTWVKRILAEPKLYWHEIQTKDDIIAFYKADPFETLAMGDFDATLKIDRVNYKKAMARKRYNAMRLSFYRMHRQYILYNDNRVAFDTLLRMFGPFRAAQLAETPELAERIDPQGNLV